MSRNIKKYNADCEFGFKSENEIFNIIKEHFNEPNLKQNSRFCKLDFAGNNLYELKSRRFTSTIYPTTMIGKNKVDKARREKAKGKDSFFLFKFTDNKLFYIYYDEELFDTYEIKISGRSDRDIIESQLYVYIPMTDLTEIEI